MIKWLYNLKNWICFSHFELLSRINSRVKPIKSNRIKRKKLPDSKDCCRFLMVALSSCWKRILVSIFTFSLLLIGASSVGGGACDGGGEGLRKDVSAERLRLSGGGRGTASDPGGVKTTPSRISAINPLVVDVVGVVVVVVALLSSLS